MASEFYTTADRKPIRGARPVTPDWELRLFENDGKVFLSVSDLNQVEKPVRLNITSEMTELALGLVAAHHRKGKSTRAIADQANVRVIEPKKAATKAPKSK